MTPREKLLALAERLESPWPLGTTEDCLAAAKAIRRLEADQKPIETEGVTVCLQCGNYDYPCRTLREAAGGDE